MPGTHELSEVFEADRGLLQANDLHLVSNEAVEAALDSLVSARADAVYAK
jgi:hypothetical protein